MTKERESVLLCCRTCYAEKRSHQALVAHPLCLHCMRHMSEWEHTQENRRCGLVSRQAAASGDRKGGSPLDQCWDPHALFDHQNR